MRCPRCHDENPPWARFCGECGVPLQEPAGAHPGHREQPRSYTPKHLKEEILTRRSALAGERKQVTVLFADVANFTAMSDRMDPEDVHQMMDGCFRILMNETHRFEGTVNQFRGDGIMALFGAPLAHEDHAERACWAALGMQGALKGYAPGLRERFGVEFKMRIGISSGTVVVGSIGDNLRMDYTADGDTTNLASRMETMAEPGCILVSCDTYRKVAPMFDFRPLGPLAVKGKGAPLDVYELRDKLDVQRSADRRIQSRLVDREDELNRLELQLLRVIRGEGSIVNVTGEPGIGKSRLIAELKKREPMGRVALLEGRAIGIGKNLSFHPLIDMLKRWSGIREEDPEEQALGRLEEAIRKACHDRTDEILPFVATLMGLKIGGRRGGPAARVEGEGLEKLLLKSTRELLVGVSRQNPVVCILDDLHWSDLTTIEFLESLLWLAEDHPILFIHVFRQGYPQTGDRLLKTVRAKHHRIGLEIPLDPLNLGSCATLIDNLTKSNPLPLAMQNRIIRLAGGNPFFIEEVIRSLTHRERGRIEDDGDGAVSIPDRIQDVITARIDKLDEETRDLLKTVSVIGVRFYGRILKEVADGVENIPERLRELQEAQLISRREGAEEEEYVFKHGLTQEAAYESILMARRRELHLKTARAMESIFSDRLHALYGILAYHYSKGEDLDRAEEYLLKAGEEALRSSASLEAINYYQEAMRLYVAKRGSAAKPEKIAALTRNIAVAFFNKGQHESALSHLDRVLEIRGVRRRKNRAVILFTLAMDLLRLVVNLYLPFSRTCSSPTPSDNEILDLSYKRTMSLVHLNPQRCFLELLRTLNRLRRLKIEEAENGIGIWMSASGLFSWSGVSFALSRKILERTRRLLNEADPNQAFYYEFFSLAHHSLSGRWAEIHAYDQPGVDANLTTGHHWHVLNYLLLYGSVKIEQGDFREVEKILGKLSEIWETYGNENAHAIKRLLSLRLLVIRGEHHRALSEVQEALAQAEMSRPSVLYYLGYHAIAQTVLGNLEAARSSLSQCRQMISRRGRIPPFFVSSFLTADSLWGLRSLEHALQAGDKREARRLRKRVRRSIEAALRNSQNYAFTRAASLRLQGQWFWLRGKQEKALRSWSKSISEARRLGAGVELAKTSQEIGERLLEEGSRIREWNGLRAEEYIGNAERLFVEMGLLQSLHDVKARISWSDPPNPPITS